MSPSRSAPEASPGRLPWRTLALIGLVYLVTASGRSGNADVELMLSQSRAFLAGQVHQIGRAHV